MVTSGTRTKEVVGNGVTLGNKKKNQRKKFIVNNI